MHLFVYAGKADRIVTEVHTNSFTGDKKAGKSCLFQADIQKALQNL